MRRTMGLVAGCVIVLAGTSLTRAESISVPVTGTQLVSGPEGRSSVLVNFQRPAVGGYVSLGSASLVFPQAAVLSPDRDLRLYVLGARSGSPEELDEGQVARVDIPAGRAISHLDITRPMRGALSDEGVTGFLVTTPDRDGFDSIEASALRAALGQGVLRVEFRRVPPPPRPRA
jgi:hypothetical protein